MESAQVALLEMRSEEILRREEYMSRSGRYLPPFFLRVVPSLRMKPLLTQRETLPLLSSPQQQEEKVSQLQSQSQPQEGEAGEDEEKESQESQGKAGESPTKSEVRPNLEELLRNVLLERRDEIRELVSRDASLRDALSSLLEPEQAPPPVITGDYVSNPPDITNPREQLSLYPPLSPLPPPLLVMSQLEHSEASTAPLVDDQGQDCVSGALETEDSLTLPINPSLVLPGTITNRDRDAEETVPEELLPYPPSPPAESPLSLSPLELLALPEVSRQLSFLYTLQEVAILWSIFIDNLYALVQYNLLPVFHPSATPGTPNHLLSPQPDWLVCVSSHEELEMLHESIRSSLIDITVVISEYFSPAPPSSSSSSSSLHEHPAMAAIASNPSLLSQITSDLISTLHFSSTMTNSTPPPIIFWEDGHYIPRGAVAEIREHIYGFLFLTRIPLTEVSKVWKISLHDLLRFVERGYLEVYRGGGGAGGWDEEGEEDPTDELIVEKSTGLSVYNSSFSFSSSSFSKRKKDKEKVKEREKDKIGPFSSSLLTSSASLASVSGSPLPSYPRSGSEALAMRDRSNSSSSRGLTSSPPPLFLTQCISRIDLYSQPSLLQTNHLTSLHELCGIFGYRDLSELLAFLSPGNQGQGKGAQGTGDALPVIEWGVEMFMITTELTEILLKWKLISLDNILLTLRHDTSSPSSASTAASGTSFPSLSASALSASFVLGAQQQQQQQQQQRHLQIHELKERILTSRRRTHRCGNVVRRGEEGGEEYFPIIDWLGESYALQEDLSEILRLFRDDRKRR